MRSTLLGLALLLTACPAAGLGTHGTGCDPQAVAPTCDGNVEARCQRNPGNPSSIVRTDCSQRHMQCLDDGSFVGCVYETQKCDPATYQPHCLDDKMAAVCRPAQPYPEVLFASDGQAQEACGVSQ